MLTSSRKLFSKWLDHCFILFPTPMIEAIVSITIAAATGFGVMTHRTHNRFSEHDKRIDQLELKIAENYITRDEVSKTFQRFEDHFVRIEHKIDNLSRR